MSPDRTLVPVPCPEARPAGPPDDDDADRGAFHRELRVATRDTGLMAGAIALVAFPAWGAFDAVLLPERARSFMMVRLGVEVLVLLAFAALRSRRLGTRWPEPLAFLILALVEVAIAWMIPRTQPHLEAYLLGFSLAVYGAAFVVVWRWQLTALLVAVAAAATAGFTALARPGLPADDVVTIAAYLLTAGAIAVAAQLHRYRAGWRQFVTHSALARERQRNLALVAELRRLSTEDDLTGLANRRGWEEWVGNAVLRARRSGSPLAVISCDFDRFKEVNDRHGHAVGDAVLRTGAALLRDRARVTDFLARLGGDEFIVACPDTTLAGAAGLAEELARLARRTPWPGGVAMTLSFGVAELHPADGHARDVLQRSDAALYAAKATRGSVVAVAVDGR